MRQIMSSYRAAALIAVCSGLLTPSPAGARQLIEAGETAPQFELADRAGGTVSLRALAGRVVVICFVRPEQERSAAALRDLAVAHVTLPEPPWALLAVVSGAFADEDVGKLVAETGFTGPVLADPKMTAYGDYGAIVTPSTVVVGRAGTVVYSRAGHDFEYETVVNAHLQFTLGLIDAARRDRLIDEGRGTLARQSKVVRLLGLARSLRMRGNPAGAEVIARKAFAEDSQSVEAHIELAEIFVDLKRPEEAIETLRKVPEEALTNGRYRLARGRVLAALGRPEGAEVEFRAALERDPKLGEAHYELGKLYREQGKLDAAIQELKEAFDILYAQVPSN